jgi:hypothetical protein
MKSAM